MEDGQGLGFEETDSLIERLIGAAFLAGAYEAVMRREPALRAGFTKLAEKWRERTAILARQVYEEATQTEASSGKLRTANSPKC